ncbi:hypothetical protein GALL_482540 [mine drainage metagenome]|uniref:Uncharacterized protein n=1 Tax=mine drainage metagenome TaxID=410659 RepID=A0A1J5PQX6_9ZZZZ
MNMRLAQCQGGQQQQDKSANQLVKQGLGGRRLGQTGAADHHRCSGPHNTAQQGQHVTQQSVGRRTGAGRTVTAPHESQCHTGKSQSDAQPLHRIKPLGWQFEVQPQGDEDRCGVQEHRAVGGVGIAQRLAEQQKFKSEQESGQPARAPAPANNRYPLLAPKHQQANRQRRQARTHRDHHDRGNIGCRHFQYRLLQAPDHAQDEHGDGGAAIKFFARVHGSPGVFCRVQKSQSSSKAAPW